LTIASAALFKIIQEQRCGWTAVSVAFWSKEKQFLHMVDCVCAVFKNTLKFKMFIKRNRT